MGRLGFAAQQLLECVDGRHPPRSVRHRSAGRRLSLHAVLPLGDGREPAGRVRRRHAEAGVVGDPDAHAAERALAAEHSAQLDAPASHRDSASDPASQDRATGLRMPRSTAAPHRGVGVAESAQLCTRSELAERGEVGHERGLARCGIGWRTMRMRGALRVCIRSCCVATTDTRAHTATIQRALDVRCADLGRKRTRTGRSAENRPVWPVLGAGGAIRPVLERLQARARARARAPARASWRRCR